MSDNVAEDPTFIKRINTDDETWVYAYDVETAQQPSEWRFKYEPKRKKKQNSLKALNAINKLITSI